LQKCPIASPAARRRRSPLTNGRQRTLRCIDSTETDIAARKPEMIPIRVIDVSMDDGHQIAGWIFNYVKASITLDRGFKFHERYEISGIQIASYVLSYVE